MRPLAIGQFVRSKISKCSVTDVEYSNRLALFIHFVKNPVNASAVAKQQAANISLRLLGLAILGAAIRKLFKGIQRIDQLSEPLEPANGARSTTQS